MVRLRLSEFESHWQKPLGKFKLELCSVFQRVLKAIK